MCNVDVCFDAEEADRLNLSLFFVNKILESDLIDTKYSGFGIASTSLSAKINFYV